MAKIEQRKFSRIEFDATVIISQRELCWKTTLVDISLKGLLAERPDNWKNSQLSYHAVIKLPEREIHMLVDLAHETRDNIGFKCVSIDLDSIMTLRRLVELNLGNEDLLEREIHAMLNAA